MPYRKSLQSGRKFGGLVSRTGRRIGNIVGRRTGIGVDESSASCSEGAVDSTGDGTISRISGADGPDDDKLSLGEEEAEGASETPEGAELNVGVADSPRSDGEEDGELDSVGSSLSTAVGAIVGESVNGTWDKHTSTSDNN